MLISDKGGEKMNNEYKRDQFLMIKVTEDEKQKIILAARKQGMTMSAFLRWIALKFEEEKK